MNVNPYLILNGDCEAAFTFYAQATGGELGPMMRFDGAEVLHAVAGAAP